MHRLNFVIWLQKLCRLRNFLSPEMTQRIFFAMCDVTRRNEAIIAFLRWRSEIEKEELRRSYLKWTKFSCWWRNVSLSRSAQVKMDWVQIPLPANRGAGWCVTAASQPRDPGFSPRLDIFVLFQDVSWSLLDASVRIACQFIQIKVQYSSL